MSNRIRITWKIPKPMRGGGCREGWWVYLQAGKGQQKAHRDINTSIKVESGGLRHNRKHDIYSHTEISGARRGAFFPIFTPHLAPILTAFCQQSILAHRWCF